MNKIYISYHRPFQFISSNICCPVHAGRDYAIQEFEPEKDKTYSGLFSLIGDNTGDNISIRNPEFCELTVLYWIWKNKLKQFDHCGLMQYRRHFIFNEYYAIEKTDHANAYKCEPVNNLSADYREKYGIIDDNIDNFCDKYDIIIPYPGDLTAIGVRTVWEDYAEKIPGTHLDDLMLTVKLLIKKNHKIGKSLEGYINGKYKLMYQMFIANQAILNNYFHFLFENLFMIDKYIDTTLYTLNGKRTLGYIGEILYGYYFLNILKNNKIKSKQLYITYIEDGGINA